MLFLTNATVATMTGPIRYGLVERGAIAVAIEGERIAWAGPHGRPGAGGAPRRAT